MKEYAMCPKCKEVLEVTKTIDTEHCGDELVAIVEGFCPSCEESYRWEEIFAFSFARKIRKSED